MITKDKKPVPFIKARDLIKKEQRDFYIVNNDDRYNKFQVINKDFNDLKEACDKKARWFYENKLGLIATALNNKRVEKLAKRLEREFLRKEEKENQLEIMEDRYEIDKKRYEIVRMRMIKIGKHTVRYSDIKSMEEFLDPTYLAPLGGSVYPIPTDDRCLKITFESGESIMIRHISDSDFDIDMIQQKILSYKQHFLITLGENRL